MGNQEALPSNIETLRAQSWVQAGEDQQNALFSNVNPYRRRLLANIITHQLIEEYELNFITQQDYNSYISQLSYRRLKKSSDNEIHVQSYIYPIRYFVNKSKHQMCTTIHTGYLYADKVDLRLKQINDIPFQDLLCVYRATLNGFKTLYQKVGYFDVVEEMVFITRGGEVRVWMNANLAKNYPNYQKSSYVSSNFSNEQTFSQKEHENLYGSQADMIRKLILMIQKNSDEYSDLEQTENQLFSQFLETNNIFDKLSFQHALQEFQNYLCQNNLHCPHYMKSIPQLFAPDQIFNSNPNNYQQSHVNEITTQHLTQIKKKFQPMETIVEDEKYPSSATNITIKNTQKHKQLHQSQVAMFTPPSISNLKEQPHPNHQNSSTKVVRPGQSPFTDMGQSRYSQQSNKPQQQYDHMRQSSHSNNVHLQQIQKPHSITLMNYGNNIPIGFPVCSPMHHQHQPQGQIKPHYGFVSQPLIPGVGYAQPQYLQHSDYPHQRVFMFPPQQNYHGVPNTNNGVHYQNVMPFNQNVFPSPSLHLQPQVNNNPQSITRVNSPSRNFNQNQINKALFSNQKTELPTIQRSKSPISPNKIPMPLKKPSVQQKQSIKSNRKNQEKNENKAKIKYFTTKESYQLDEQIANDLQKFLGLKVN